MDNEHLRMHMARLRDEMGSLRVHVQALCHDLESTRREKHDAEMRAWQWFHHANAETKRADTNAALARLYLEDIKREAEGGDDDDMAGDTR